MKTVESQPTSPQHVPWGGSRSLTPRDMSHTLFRSTQNPARVVMEMTDDSGARWPLPVGGDGWPRVMLALGLLVLFWFFLNYDKIQLTQKVLF